MNKKLIVVALAAVVLSGCSMTRTEMMDAVDECKSRGYTAKVLINGFNYRPRAVICKIPKAPVVERSETATMTPVQGG
jgi:hypothetical protein